jgi:hypothetical protein
MVLIYSAVTLSTLGSTKAPQTPWTSSEYNESVILDLGEYEGPTDLPPEFIDEPPWRY